MATLTPPPPDCAVRPVHYTLSAGTAIHRIYDPDSHFATANGFRTVGPYGRFDHHTKAKDDRGILYAGETFKDCLVEIYGDRKFGLTVNRRHCQLRLLRELILLDLRGDGAMRAGTITKLCSGPHRMGQRWSRYFYENEARYGVVDGIVYHNAHNEGEVYALYERANRAFIVIRDNRLDDGSRRDEYVQAALSVNITVGFQGQT
jgi:hypothetical protein